MAQASTYNRAQLARAYGVSLPAVDGWVRRGCPHQRRAGGEYVFHLDEVAGWRARQLEEDSHRVRGRNGRPIPHGAREWLDALLIGHKQALPWLVDRLEPGLECAHVVDIEEYRRRSGIDGDELLLRLAFGLPTLPPAPGKTKGARISLPHAAAWLLLLSAFVESVGGDGFAKRIAHEAQRLRGYPVAGEPEEGEGEAGDEADGALGAL